MRFPIEGFRAGRHAQQRGVSNDAVKQFVNNYDPSLSAAPFTIGHPSDDSEPGYGYATGLTLKENGIVTVDDGAKIPKSFSDLIDKGHYNGISFSLFPPDHESNPKPGEWYLRHIAVLGAVPPYIPGLKGLQDFSEDSFNNLVTVDFSNESVEQSILSKLASLINKGGGEKTKVDQPKKETIDMSGKDEKDRIAKLEADLAKANKRADAAESINKSNAKKARKKRAEDFATALTTGDDAAFLPRHYEMLCRVGYALNQSGNDYLDFSSSTEGRPLIDSLQNALSGEETQDRNLPSGVIDFSQKSKGAKQPEEYVDFSTAEGSRILDERVKALMKKEEIKDVVEAAKIVQERNLALA